MGRVQVIADLHVDVWNQTGIDPLEHVPLEDLDALILAGDISNKGHIHWPHIIAGLAGRIDPARIFLMPGNHDYYGGRIDREDKLRDAAESAGAHFIQKSELIFGDTRFLCCTLWTDMLLGGDGQRMNGQKALSRMNDFRAIRVEAENYRRLHPLATILIHDDHKAWLQKRLASPFEGHTVVVTHHAPAPDCLPPDEWDDVPFCYGSDLTGMIEQFQPDYWLYGHTHYPSQFSIGATQVINLSIGRPGPENQKPDCRGTTVSFSDEICPGAGPQP